MNCVQITGRLTADPQIRTTQSGQNVATFTVAVDRRFKDANGNRQADFLNCVAWRNTADFVGRWFSKGQRIAVTGSIQTRTYDAQDGSRRYATEIIAENVEFDDSRQSTAAQQTETDSTGFTEVEPDDSLPF